MVSSSRIPVMAANWKMNKNLTAIRNFFADFLPRVVNSTYCEIVVAPPFTGLEEAVRAARGSRVSIAAQNMFWEPEGAFTGEVAAPMLVEVGCSGVILGHSERRQIFGETDTMVSRKVKAALSAGLRPIVCVGETEHDRERGATEEILETQFVGAFAALTAGQFSSILLAYEPVWAIGSGRTATPELAADAHRLLRSLAETRFGREAAANLRILYGGSVKPGNIRGLMAQQELDGALVGGASLDAASFATIVNFREV